MDAFRVLRNPDLLMVLGFFVVFPYLRTLHPFMSRPLLHANGHCVRYLPKHLRIREN